MSVRSLAPVLTATGLALPSPGRTFSPVVGSKMYTTRAYRLARSTSGLAATPVGSSSTRRSTAAWLGAFSTSRNVSTWMSALAVSPERSSSPSGSSRMMSVSKYAVPSRSSRRFSPTWSTVPVSGVSG